ECSEHGQLPGGSVPRFLPGLAHQRHGAGDGSHHLGAKDSGDHSHRLEERSTFRRGTTETASSLSVSDKESVPSLGDHPLAVASRVLLETLGSRESIYSEVRRFVCFGTLSPLQPYAPSLTQESCRPRVSDRTMVGNSATRLACEFQRTRTAPRRHDEHETPTG